MIRRRALLLCLQALIAAQLTFGASLARPAPAAAAGPAASASAAASTNPAGGAAGAAGAAAACALTSSAGGGLLSACAGAASYADFAAGLTAALGDLQADANTGSLTIRSDPAGATVALNGIEAGITPLDVAVPPGVYLVRITKAGFVPFSHVVQVAAGVPTNVPAPLEALDGGNEGSFNWVRPNTIIGLLGGNGFANGDFVITGYVRDKDGADYISFANSKVVEITFAEPTEFDNINGWLKSDHTTVSTVGVARSSDDGLTWTLIKSWTGSFTSREWTSARFDDAQWLSGKPGDLKSRWVRAYYHQRKIEEWSIWAMVPRPEGGVAVYATKITWDQPQELLRVWDGLGGGYNGTTYCREDDTDPLCYQRPNPGRYMTSLVAPYTGPSLVEAGSGPYKTVTSTSAISRYGMSQLDLATYNQVRTVATTVLNTRDGGETANDLAPLCCGVTYQGSYKDADYFLARDGGSGDVKGYIYVARKGAAPVLETTYTLEAGAPKGTERSEELRIGPDGTLYLLDHNRGRVYVLEKGVPVLLGSVPAAIWGGLLGATAPSLNYLATAIDSGGNVQAAFRVGTLASAPATLSDVKVYYEYFSRQKVAYDSVALFTKADCPACDAARAWLKAAGVPFKENPGGLSAAVTALVAAAQGGAGLPVIARLGADTVVKGAAEPGVISRLLGVSYPVLVDTHPARLGKTAPGVVDPFRIVAHQPDWVLMVLEGDQPRVVVQRDDGVVSLAPAGGSWTATKLMNSPPPASVTVVGGATGFNARYPMFPGGAATPYVGTARDVPFNTFAKVGDLRFLFLGDGGYTLNTTKPAATASTYNAIESVSQLIPSAAFYVALGPNGKAGPVKGELAAYVTSQGVVTDNGYRFYRVVADLRAQNETASDGDIPARAMAGAVTVETKTKDGAPDTRDVSLILLVENTRLHTFEPDSRAVASDITSEAIHFAGPDEHWIVTNNIALPNSIPCEGGNGLLLKPNSTTTFTAAQAANSALGSCLAGLEVQPTVLTGCTSWDDARLVLTAQTIASLGTSLPLARSESVTNWELTFGNRDATVYRLVSLDQAASGTGAPHCATEVTGRTAAVVKISGRFLGSNEVYAPTLTIVESGTTPVITAPTTLPESIAFERRWLVFESAFLEGNLRLANESAGLVAMLYLKPVAKLLGYWRQLLAVRAVLHCNQEGIGVAAIVRVMARPADIPEASAAAQACLGDFVLHPSKHWPGYQKAIWSGGGSAVAFLSKAINTGLVANPTLAYLASLTGSTPQTYGQVAFAHAKALQASGNQPGHDADIATDFALDDYARLATVASGDLHGATAPMIRMVMLQSQLERTAMGAVATCVKTFPGPQPLARVIQLTAGREYTGGIPCVDQAPTAGRTDRYRLLAIGLRSGTFEAIYKAAGRDLDLVTAQLSLLAAALAEVQAAQARHAAGVTAADWDTTLPAVDRLVIATGQIQAIAEKRAKEFSLAKIPDGLRGIAQCVSGVAMGFVSGEGILMVVLGSAAAYVGSTAAVVGGVLFVGFGLVTTAVGGYDLTQAWETLDTVAASSGICGVAAGSLLTLAGVYGTAAAARAWTPAQLKYAPSKMIDVKALFTRGRTAGLSLEEQGEITVPRGDTISDVAAVAPPPLEPALKAVVDALPEGRRGLVLDAIAKVGYDSCTALEQSVIRDLIVADKPSILRAEKIWELAKAGKEGSPEDLAWSGMSTAWLRAMDTSHPKSLAAEPVTAAAPAPPSVPALPARLAGADAAVEEAASNAANVVPGSPVGFESAVQGRQPYLLKAAVGSERLLNALRDPKVKRLYAPEEAVTLLGKAKAALGTTTAAFFTELASPRLLDSIRVAVKAAQDLAGTPGKQVTALETTMLKPGQNKVAVLVTIHQEGAAVLRIVIAKGKIGLKEAANYKFLGSKQITQKLLAPLLENVDGDQALLITEYVPNDIPQSLTQGMGPNMEPGMWATNDPAWAGAVGALDARIFLETDGALNGQPGSMYNSDPHYANMSLFTENGAPAARIIDFDPNYTWAAPEDAYWMLTLLQRNLDSINMSTVVVNFEGYLDGVVGAFASKPGSSRAAAYDMFRRVSAEITTPAGKAKATAIEPGFADGFAIADVVAREVRAWLAKHGQSRLPGPVLAVADGPAGGAIVPLTALVIVLPRRVRPDQARLAA